MPNTVLHIHEYDETTKSYRLDGVVATGSLWEDCLNAIAAAGFRPQQHPNHTIRRPNAWSNPANNVGNGAAAQAFNQNVLANPHVHGGQGVNHRAAIGCRNTPATSDQGAVYQYMNIYIGEFS